MMQFEVRQLVLTLGFYLLLISSAQADFIASIGDLTLSGGSSGFVDVWIESNGSDPLQTFQVELQITPVGTTQSLLHFASSQPDPSGDGGYVFFNNSDFYSTTFDSSHPDKLTVGDFTSNFSDVQIDDPPKLLARINLVSSGTPSTTDEFLISLLPASGDSTGFLDTPPTSNTGFLDRNFNPIAFSSNSGTVMVMGAQPAAVPEPASGTLLAIGIFSLLAYGRRQRRSRLNQVSSGEEMRF